MNRTDRLLAIVLELQRKGRQRAEDLAATFETSKRTIYRDIEALSEAGVPLLAVPGQGYELMEGYFLPPLSFTTAEASMLLLGSDFVANNFDEEYQVAAQDAGRKIEAVLPEKLRTEVHQLQDNIRFISPNAGDPPVIQKLRRAILENKTIRYRYFSRRSVQANEQPHYREADPYGLIFYNGVWYLSAYSHPHRQVRSFRLDRIVELEVLPQTFIRPPDFRLEDSQDNASRVITVRVLFAPPVVRWIKESNYYYIAGYEETEAGLLVTLRVRQERDVLGWLLSWGQHARVLEPESLRQHLQEEAVAILQKYQNPPELLT
jgi:predicted DNA-binding transcriptional regulator YafY